MPNAGAIRAGQAFVEITTDNAALERGLRAAQARLRAFGAGLKEIGAPLAAIGGAVAGALLGATKGFAAMGDTVEKMSRRTGVSVEALSELGFAAEQSGADLDTLETGLRKMQRTVADAAVGSGAAAEALSRLGLGVQDVMQLSPEQQFKLIADRLSGVADPTQRAALAMELFGKSGTRLLPMLEGGARGLEALQAQARALGLTISAETARDAAKLNDELNILWRVVKQGVFTVGSALAPTVSTLANIVTRVTVRIRGFIDANQELVRTVFRIASMVAVVGGGLVAIGTAIAGVGAALGGMVPLVKAATAAFTFLGPFLGALVSPIGLVAAAVVGLGTVILTYTGAGARALAWLGDTFRWLSDAVMDVVGGIVDALAAGDIALAARVLWAGMKVAWETGIAPLLDLWNAFRFALERTAVNAFAGIKKACISVTTWMWKNFPEVTVFIAKTWVNLTARMRMVWAEFQNWLSDRWLEVIGMFDESLDVEAAKAVGRQRLDEQFGQIEADRARGVAEAERRSRLTDQQRAAEEAAALAQIELEQAEALAGINAAHDERVRHARDDLRAAQAELAEARARAREARAQAQAPPRPGAMAGIDFEGIGAALERKLSVSGTFNAAVLFGLAGGVRTQERIARATEDTARDVRRIRERGGLTFTES